MVSQTSGCQICLANVATELSGSHQPLVQLLVLSLTQTVGQGSLSGIFVDT